MKKQLIIAAITCLFGISCKKTDIAPSPQPVKEYFRGKLNGIAFNDTIKGKIFSIAINGLTGVQISGYHADGEISLHLRPFAGETGQVPLTENTNIFVWNKGAFFYANATQGSGKIIILEVTSSYIRGSFEGVVSADPIMSPGAPSQIITEGEFKLKKP